MTRRDERLMKMIMRVERETEGQERMLLLMALEWAANFQYPSTSLALEDWLDEKKENETK